MTDIHAIIARLRASRFFRDSTWAVGGNGMGYGLLLLAGVLIARLLGKEVYGEYGFVKTTMFQFAAFSTLGLGYTSTKFVAEYRARACGEIRGVIRASMDITLAISVAIALLLFVFARPLAEWLAAPTLCMAFQALGAIIVLRAVGTTQAGILAGFGDFRKLAYINTSSGVFMVTACVPLTWLWGLRGSLAALALSQVLVTVLGQLAIRQQIRLLPTGKQTRYVWRLTRFSVPVAMQELTYALARWGGMLLITRLSSLGEVGIYTACEMWGSVILFAPSLLSNVMLSHLSYHADDARMQKRGVNIMLAVNLTCTLIPFVGVYLFTPFIVTMYGPTFAGMETVLRLLIFTTIFSCCSNVLSSELIAQGCTWVLFSIRCSRDVLTVAVGYLLISSHGGQRAAYDFAVCTLSMAVLFFCLLYTYYRVVIRRRMREGGADV